MIVRLFDGGGGDLFILLLLFAVSRCGLLLLPLCGGRREKVEAGVVTVLSELSTSYKEKNQLYCARALCNLACRHGSERSLVEGGGVSALMMIALVRTAAGEDRIAMSCNQ